MTMKAFTLVGVDGNAFSIMSYTINAMKQAGFSNSEISAYQHDCMSNDYDSLIAKSMGMIDECNEILDLDDYNDDDYNCDDDDYNDDYDCDDDNY